MNALEVLSIVQNVQEWRGDVYKLAMLIADKQKEVDAVIVETMDQVDGAPIAAAIRGQ